MSNNHLHQENKSKKVRVNIKARLIDKQTQEEHKDYEVLLDTTNLVIKSLSDLENFRVPLKFKINPKSVVVNDDVSLISEDIERQISTDTNKSFGTGAMDTPPTAFTPLNMSQNTKFMNESLIQVPTKSDDPPKRTIGHVSIQEHPNASEYLMENQSPVASSIFQSNILDESMGYVPLQNQSTPPTSQYYDPNVAHTRMKRFIFKIPAVAAGDTKKKIVRTKITFNLKNLLKHSVFASDEIGRKFVNFSGSDVQEIKKVSKHENILTSDEIFVEGEASFRKKDKEHRDSVVNEEKSVMDPTATSLKENHFHDGEYSIEISKSENSSQMNDGTDFVPSRLQPNESFELTDSILPEMYRTLSDDLEEISKYEEKVISSEKLEKKASQSKLAFDSFTSIIEKMSQEKILSQTNSGKISTVQSSLQRLGEALEHSLKVIADTKFKAVSMESNDIQTEEDIPPPSQEKRPSVSFTQEMLPPQFHSTPIHSHDNGINITELSHIVGTEDAAIVKSIIQVAQIWKNLKDKIIAERNTKIKTYDDILTENELVSTFAGIVKEIIGMPSAMKAALMMKDKLTSSGSFSRSQQVSSTETLDNDSPNMSKEKFMEDPDVRSLRRISKELQDAINQENGHRRSSTKSTINLLHPSEESSISKIESVQSDLRSPLTKSSNSEKYHLSLSDSQLKILADTIAKSLKSRSSFTMSDVPSNASTRSSRMEKNLYELKQNIIEMKNKMQRLSNTPHDTYEEEVIVTHEQLVDDLEIPDQLIATNIEQARRIVNELEQRNLLRNNEEVEDNNEEQQDIVRKS